MRKRYFFLSLFFLFYFLLSGAQSPVTQITRNYFRSDPFVNDFSSFVSHLMNDPTLTNKIIQKKTDTSLFYFEGTYTSHNPFFFKPTSVEVILAQSPVDLDSITRDTIYIYQLLAFNKGSDEGQAELKKEFDKIFKKYRNSFARNSYTENDPAQNLPGATYNFFDPLHAVAPFAVTWVGPDEDNRMCLILTIRLSIRLNEAILPVPFY